MDSLVIELEKFLDNQSNNNHPLREQVSYLYLMFKLNETIEELETIETLTQKVNQLEKNLEARREASPRAVNEVR